MFTNKRIKIKPEILKSYRQTTNTTQDSLSMAVGVHISCIKKIEGTGNTSLKNASKIAEALDITVETLTGEETPILENYWLQTSRNSSKFDEPGTLYRSYPQMLMDIKKEVMDYLPIIHGTDLETVASVCADNVLTTLVFAEPIVNSPKLSFKYSKISIRPDTGIFTSKMTSYEVGINTTSLSHLLSNTTTSYQFNNETIGTAAYFKITTYSSHVCSDKAPRYQELDQRTFNNLNDCSGIIRALINNYNPSFLNETIHDTSVEISCFHKNGEIFVIKVDRLFQKSDGQEASAPFPDTWKSLFKTGFKHNPEQTHSEISPLQEFIDRHPLCYDVKILSPL